MSWFTAMAAAIASACLTLAGVHLLVWIRQRRSLANLAYALVALGTAGMAAGEFAMLRAETPSAYAEALRWYQVPVWATVVAVTAFVRIHLRAGRLALAWSIVGLRTFVVAVNFASAVNVNYRAIGSLRRVRWFGEEASVPVGEANPWMIVAQFSLLLLLVYVVEASFQVWRRGERRAALLVGGGTVVFVVSGVIQAILVFWGLVPMPLAVSPFFTGLLLAMGYELSTRVLRAGELAGELQARETELRQERALTDAVFDSVPGLLHLYSADGKLRRWNRQYEIRTGYSSEELAGRAVADWFAPGDLGAFRAAWDQVFAGGSALLELPIRFKDGSLVPHLLTGVRVLIDSQPHLVGIGIDVAARRAIEVEVARQRAELSHLARVASLSELSGALAHELNQPLTGILSNAQAAERLLARHPPDLAEVRDIIADIVAEDRRAADVIQRLRSLLTRGEPDCRPLSVNDLVREVVVLTRSELAGRGVTLVVDLAEGLPAVSGDRIPLQQVLVNLVTNACDAMAGNPASDRHLTIGTRADGAGVRWSVRDRGCGLPAEADRMFESFFTTKPHGLGMGLAIARTIVNAHGGRLWAEPAPDRGAVFHVFLSGSGATA